MCRIFVHQLLIAHYAYITLDFGMNLGLKYKGK
ncbi:hypothetical protein H0A61_02037 [Koleobacter methoxysyntrophicus]|uniref:Uncharacterized protein n=1 Tax=Koleobacter methoxysyntrophicus TaxID=2751313 RepID=A0A8A0RQ21_9FIRM|nr:hypothetical protein H0A61_02037 [Koleobacter methoxysyntrophicus]